MVGHIKLCGDWACQVEKNRSISYDRWCCCVVFQMNLFHQLIVRQQKAAAEKQLVMAGSKKPKYEYDSDEDTEGGTWEHSKRNSEMESTRGTWIFCTSPIPQYRV